MKIKEAIELILDLKARSQLTAKENFVEGLFLLYGYEIKQAEELWNDAIDSRLYTDAVIRRRNEARNRKRSTP